MKSFTSFNLMIMILMLVSCGKDLVPPVPTIAPESSLSMNYSDFNNLKSANLLLENWGYSFTNVSFFSTMSTSYISIPALAYGYVITQTPTYIGDMTWQWSYNFSAAGVEYSATLNGTTDKKGSNTSWEMYISSSTAMNEVNDFLWFEGTTKDSLSANWTIYTNPSSPEKVIASEWERNQSTNESSLKYIYYNDDDKNNNSTITYTQLSNTEFDRTYDIYLSSIDAEINIEWSSEFHNGRVQSQNHYKDKEWHCWNELFIDASCD